MAKDKDDGDGKDLMPWEQPALPATEEDLSIAAELDAALGNLGAAIAQAGGVAAGIPYIGIGKTGSWKWGRESTEVQPGSVWVADVRTIMSGSVAWIEGKATKVMTSIGDTTPVNLPPGLPWQPNFSVEMTCLTGEDRGTTCLYETSSYGGRAAFDELRAAIKRQAMKKDGKVFPVLELLTRGYTNSYGPQVNPVLKIVGWLGLRDMGQIVDPPPVLPPASPPPPPPPAPEPAKRGPGRPRLVAEPAPAPEPVATRRRRAVGETA